MGKAHVRQPDGAKPQYKTAAEVCSTCVFGLRRVRQQVRLTDLLVAEPPHARRSGLCETPPVVWSLNALLRGPRNALAIGQHARRHSGAVVPSPAHQHHAQLGNFGARLELVRRGRRPHLRRKEAWRAVESSEPSVRAAAREGTKHTTFGGFKLLLQPGAALRRRRAT